MNVVIIGAGMGGLTTGIALKKFGHQVRIFEQTERFFRSAPQFHCGRMG